MILEKGDEGRPRGRGRFTLEDSIELDVKEIMYGVIGWIQDYGNKVMGTRQWNCGLHTDEEFIETWASISFLQRTALF